MIRILLFARLRELLGAGHIEIEHCADETASELVQRLVLNFGEGWQVLSEADTHIAVNQKLTSAQHCLCDGDEVAFFPPVTGG